MGESKLYGYSMDDIRNKVKILPSHVDKYVNKELYEATFNIKPYFPNGNNEARKVITYIMNYGTE